MPPIVLAACSTDGYVRERALAAPAMGTDPRLLPVLVIRTADWVVPVRAQARAMLPGALASAGTEELLLAVGVALEMRDWRRGDFAVAAVTQALRTAPDQTLAAARRTTGLRTRRLGYEIWLDGGHADLDALLAAVLAERDIVCRSRSTDAAVDLAVRAGRENTLRRLLACRSARVRAAALTGLVKLGQPEAGAEFLSDSSPMVRATAQWATRRANREPADHYRAALLGATAAPAVRGLVAGLGECGNAGDLDLLMPFLHDDRARVRAETVRAIRRLDGELTQLTALLTDPAPIVVRAVSRALRTQPDLVPADQLWELLCDEGRAQHVRLGVFNQLIARDAWTRINADLTLITTADAQLGTRARADLATWLAHDAATTYAAPTDHDREQLTSLIDAAAPILGPHATKKVRWYLSSTR
ncbi:MAG: HEAT repeat domain-containing protein [Actinomadura sp.]